MYLKLKNTLSALFILLVIFTSGIPHGNSIVYAAIQPEIGPEIPLISGLTWNNLGPSSRTITLNIKGDMISLMGETFRAAQRFSGSIPQDVLDNYSNVRLFESGWSSDNVFEGPDGIHQIFYHEFGKYLAVEYLKCPENKNFTCITVWKSEQVNNGTKILAGANTSVAPEVTDYFGKTAPVDGATGVNYSNVFLSWAKYVPAPEKYSYCIKEGSECASNDPNWTGTFTERSIQLFNLSPGKIYYWQVKAMTCMDCVPKEYVYADEGIFWRFTTASSLTLIPPAVTASDGTDTNKVTVSWTASGSATYYKVYRSETLSGTKLPTDGVTTTSLSGADVWGLPGVTYYYWVKACNATTCGDLSNTETGWRSLAAPTITASDGAFADKVDVSWTAITGATSYMAYRSETLSGIKTPAQGFTTTSLSGIDTWATPGLTYYYWVKACNNTNCGDFNAAETGWRKPAAPTVTASDGTFTDKVDVSWTASTGATSYVVYRSETLSGEKIPTIGLTTTSLGGSDTYAIPGLTYYYWVKACNSVNCSDLGVAQGRRGQ